MEWKQPISTLIFDYFGTDHLVRDLYIHLLIRARIKDMEKTEYFNGKPYRLKSGQSIFGRNTYAERLRCSPSGIIKCLKRLEEVYSLVTCKKTHNYTVVTFKHFSEVIHMGTSKEASKEQANIQAGDTNKNGKNIEKREGKLSSDFKDNFWNIFESASAVERAKHGR